MSYEFSPITLIGGIAQNMNGGSLPILYLLQPGAFPDGPLTASPTLQNNELFAHFRPLPGGKLIENETADYPLANQVVASNAIIVQPLKFSLLMDCPAQGDGGYYNKLPTITSLQNTLAKHTLSGGAYNVATPSFIYTNCLLLDLVDVSTGDTKQVQTAWQWNFYQPLLTLAQADQAQNNLMSKLSGQTQTSADSDGAVGWSGPGNTVNQPPSLAGPAFVPSAGGGSGAVAGSTQGPPQ
jgi:hypothetical protein